jgi:hypothetical protein
LRQQALLRFLLWLLVRAGEGVTGLALLIRVYPEAAVRWHILTIKPFQAELLTRLLFLPE